MISQYSDNIYQIESGFDMTITCSRDIPWPKFDIFTYVFFLDWVQMIMHFIVLCYSITLTVGKYFDDKKLEDIFVWGTSHIHHQTSTEVGDQQLEKEKI